MVEPVSDIKVGLKVWKYYGIARDAWQRFETASKQIDGLQRRVAELEKRLERCPAEGCPHCGALAFRVESSQPDFNFPALQIRQMKCEECNFAERWVFDPNKGRSSQRS